MFQAAGSGWGLCASACASNAVLELCTRKTTMVCELTYSVVFAEPGESEAYCNHSRMRGKGDGLIRAIELATCGFGQAGRH